MPLAVVTSILLRPKPRQVEVKVEILRIDAAAMFVF
jgi:hypothetical protein